MRIAAGRAALRWVISAAAPGHRPLRPTGAHPHRQPGGRPGRARRRAGRPRDHGSTDPPPAAAARQIASYPQVLVVPARHRAGRPLAGPAEPTWPGWTCWCRRPGGPTGGRWTRPWSRPASTGRSRPRSTAGTCWCTSPRSASAPRSSTAASRLPSRLRAIPISDLPAGAVLGSLATAAHAPRSPPCWDTCSEHARPDQDQQTSVLCAASPPRVDRRRARRRRLGGHRRTPGGVVVTTAAR